MRRTTLPGRETKQDKAMKDSGGSVRFKLNVAAGVVVLFERETRYNQGKRRP